MRLISSVFSVLAAAALLTVGLLGSGLQWPPAIERVVVRGATPLTEIAVHDWLASRLPSDMLTADPHLLQRQLLEHFPLADVVVERQWPRRIEIRVTERRPYAMLLDEQGRSLLVDRDGRPASPRFDQEIALWDRPVLRGCPLVATGVDAAGTTACARIGVSFLVWLDTRAPQWIPELSELRVDGDSVSVYLEDGMRIDFGEAPFGPKLEALAHAWSLARARGLEVERIVLTDRNTVVIKTFETNPARARGPQPNSERRSHEA